MGGGSNVENWEMMKPEMSYLPENSHMHYIIFKIGVFKRKLVFQLSIFRCDLLVAGWVRHSEK